MCHRTLSRQILQRFLGRAQEYWDQFDEHYSHVLHCVKQTSEKIKVRRLVKCKSKGPHQRSPDAMKFEDDLQKRLQDKSDVPAEMRGNLPGKSVSLKRKTKLHSINLLRSGFCWPHPPINPGEREFVEDSGASVHMVSKKDLNKAELETVRISKNRVMVMTANGEVQTKEEATENVRELDLFVTVLHQQFFRLENSAKNLGTVTIGPVARNHISTGRPVA